MQFASSHFFNFSFFFKVPQIFLKSRFLIMDYIYGSSRHLLVVFHPGYLTVLHFCRWKTFFLTCFHLHSSSSNSSYLIIVSYHGLSSWFLGTSSFSYWFLTVFLFISHLYSFLVLQRSSYLSMVSRHGSSRHLLRVFQPGSLTCFPLHSFLGLHRSWSYISSWFLKISPHGFHPGSSFLHSF